MYYDYYLNTPDEASMTVALQQAEATDADGNPVAGVLIDVIGTHYERTGGTDEEPVYSQVPGWHVNVRSDHELHWPEGAYTGQPHAPWRSFGPLPTPPELLGEAGRIASRRYQAEVLGVRFHSYWLATDRESRALLDQELMAIQRGERQDGEGWKCRDAETGEIVFWEALNADLQATASAVRSYVKACFGREAELLAELSSGVYSPEHLHVGWPAQVVG